MGTTMVPWLRRSYATHDRVHDPRERRVDEGLRVMRVSVVTRAPQRPRNHRPVFLATRIASRLVPVQPCQCRIRPMCSPASFLSRTAVPRKAGLRERPPRGVHQHEEGEAQQDQDPTDHAQDPDARAGAGEGQGLRGCGDDVAPASTATPAR